jgi:hypothetical protein
VTLLNFFELSSVDLGDDWIVDNDNVIEVVPVGVKLVEPVSTEVRSRTMNFWWKILVL